MPARNDRRDATTRTAPYDNPYVRSDPHDAFANEFIESVDALTSHRPTIGCIVPAYNEEDTIGEVLESLLAQTRLPDVIHVIVNNTTDRTIKVAGEYAGPHIRIVDDVEQSTEIFIHDIGQNPDKKVGALNYGYSLVEGCDYLLGVDGDTTADKIAIEKLSEEIASDSRVGGISAIYSIDDTVYKGRPIASFLIAGQRAQFAAFNMQNMLRGRNMAVLGGQFSIFSVRALREVMVQNHQRTPWVRDSEVEDSLLSLQIKNAGFLTKISALARADVGGMDTMRGLDAQQVKWNFGAIELMWPGQRGDTKGQPFHPNLRLRWFEHLSMVVNALTRVMFIVLLVASLSIGAFVFSPIWLVPPLVATILNMRVALSMKSRNAKDIAFAILIFPAEIYMWIRIGHFLRSWSKFASRKTVDNWAEQAKAESGSGNAFMAPLVIAILAMAALVFIWFQLSPLIQSTILWIGWPVLGIITVLQTFTMLTKAIRRHRGYKV